MSTIYLDNASTNFPKPKEVADAMYNYLTQAGYNINRSNTNGAYDVADAVFATRQLLCDMFQGEDCKNVVFTKNITEALNIVLKGLLHPGDHVLVSSLEHNAVMRPMLQMGAVELNAADAVNPITAMSTNITDELCISNHSNFTAATPTTKNITFTRIPCTPAGDLCVETIKQLLQPNTKAIILTHASNVCGTLQPLAEVGPICQQHGLKFIVDSAQTAGLFPINMQSMHIDALCFTGHKGLLGPQGIGGFILKESMVELIAPFITGGTGSVSHREIQPTFMPDKFEAGTLNLPGIMGLKAALEWLKVQGMDKLRQHELKLTERFLTGLGKSEAKHLLRIIGHKDIAKRTSVISITTDIIDLAEVAYRLDTDYHIATRVGLHCAPHAHKALGTYPTGTLRFSCGWHNTPAEIDTALQALEEVLTHGL